MHIVKKLVGIIVLAALVILVLVATTASLFGGVGAATGELTTPIAKLVVVGCGLSGLFALQLAFRARDRL